MTSRRMNAAVIESNMLGKTDCVCSLACWHTAMPNLLGSDDRRCVIMGWQAQAAGPMLTPEHMAELEGMGRMTDTLRRLVGAPEA